VSSRGCSPRLDTARSINAAGGIIFFTGLGVVAPPHHQIAKFSDACLGLDEISAVGVRGREVPCDAARS
jgi:hypothetical protein